MSSAFTSWLTGAFDLMFCLYKSLYLLPFYIVLPLARTSTPVEQCLQDLVSNSEMGRLLEETQLEGYEEAAVLRYLHDFVHMVYKPTVSEEEKV